MYRPAINARGAWIVGALLALGLTLDQWLGGPPVATQDPATGPPLAGTAEDTRCYREAVDGLFTMYCVFPDGSYTLTPLN